MRLEACGEGPRGASPGAPRRRDGAAATRPACGPRDRGASCRAALALALALALTGCFRDPGYDGQDVTGETAAASDASSSTAASTPDLPDETSETTGCETGDCATTTGTGECVISPPSGGCVVPITHGSAQEAIDDPDCAEVYLMPGVHKGTLTISRDLTVRADCEGDVVLDGDGQGTTVTVLSGSVTLRRLVITGGASFDGGGVHNQGVLDLIDCSVQANEATRGGGIYSAGELLLLQSSVVIDNLVTLAEDQQSPDGNTAVGGGVYVSGGDLALADATVIADNRVELIAPFATGAGGGVRAENATVTISDDSVLRGNVVEVDSLDGGATSYGGGLYIAGAASSLLVDGATVRDNRVSALGYSDSIRAAGGGVASQGAALSVVNASLHNNQVSASTEGALPEVQAVARGGGLFFTVRDGEDPSAVVAELRASTFADNIALQSGVGMARGGGLDILALNDTSIGTVVLDACTVSGNWASADVERARGGGLAVAVSAGAAILRLAARQSTFSGNTAQLTDVGISALGGGVYAQATTMTGKLELQLSGVTIAGNAASGELADLGIAGGLTYETIGDPANPVAITLRNTILADNTADGGSPNCMTQPIMGLESAGYNLFGAIDGCVIEPMQDSDLVDAAPALAQLADNGGPTKTMAVSLDSPALDGGDPLGCVDELGGVFTVDQRGQPRVVGERCDIGAYELQ